MPWGNTTPCVFKKGKGEGVENAFKYGLSAVKILTKNMLKVVDALVEFSQNQKCFSKSYIVLDLKHLGSRLAYCRYPCYLAFVFRKARVTGLSRMLFMCLA